MIPDWLDTDNLQWMILAAMAVLVSFVFMVLRFVQKLIMKGILVALLAGLGLSLWVQRADLQDCAKTCECSLYGQEISLSYDQIPQTLRDRIDAGDTTICPGVSATTG